jgi:peptidoglycan/xylan/chitin deacetylase (PgdA/CDA1 family)
MTVAFAAHRIPVLLYHRIAADPEDRYAVLPERFAEHIDSIAAGEHSPMTVGQVADCLRGARPLPPRPVAITFDDGYEDTLAAVDALIASGLRATVYVTSGALDQPGALSTAQLLELGRRCAEVEIGAHSVTHPYLDALPEQPRTAELATSKRELEQRLGRRVDTFAYPHGAYDAGVRSAVIDAGFRSAAAVKNAISHELDDPWAIARYTVTSRTTVDHVRALLKGLGAPVAWRKERARTRAARAARRVRYRFRDPKRGRSR